MPFERLPAPLDSPGDTAGRFTALAAVVAFGAAAAVGSYLALDSGTVPFSLAVALAGVSAYFLFRAGGRLRAASRFGRAVTTGPDAEASGGDLTMTLRTTRLRLAQAEDELKSWKRQFDETVEAERQRARRDPLTGSLNHAAIMEELHAKICGNGSGSHLAIALADVDGLKATNDTYGHQLGDAALVTVVHALGAGGGTVGRYGGDEFVVILPGSDRDGAEGYRDTVLSTIAASPLYHPDSGARVPISISLGLAIYPDEAGNAEDLIKLADNAMYASRRLRPVLSGGTDAARLLSSERAAKLVAEIVPLLTSPGSREDKLRLVAHHLSVGAGYDAVNFEVAGAPSETSTEWEGTFVRASSDIIEAWMREQSGVHDHPLGQILERTRRPIFLDDAANDVRLTESERALLSAAGIRSGLVVPMIWGDRIVGMLSVGSKQEAAFTSWDAQFLTAISSEVTAIIFTTTLVEELEAASENLRQAYTETVMMLAATAEAHDDTTGRHLRSVRALAETLARELEYGDEKAREIGLASVLHDIGKIRVPDSVLASSSALTDAEWAVMKQHTIWGAEFLDGRLGFELATVIARSHHERWDGSGYPRGLTGDEISEAALITAVADSFDAMTSDRPYRAGRPASAAIEELLACSGQQFSPRVVNALVRLYERNALPFGTGEHAESKAA